MWKGADEPWWGHFEPAELQYAFCVATSRGERSWCGGQPTADEEHLWVTIQAPRGTAEDLAPYATVTDIHGVDDYPVAFDEPDPDLHEVGRWTDTIGSITPSGAVWTTLQVCASGSSGPDGAFVLPTKAQERYMVYDAIVNGARSIAFYGGNLDRCWSDTDTARGWNWTFWDGVLDDLVREINAESPLGPALVNPGTTKTLESSDATTQAISREGTGGSDLWVIAARSGADTAAVTISGLPERIRQGNVYGESRAIDVANGAFTDSFGRWDVHVYHFTVPPPPAPPQPLGPPPPPPPVVQVPKAPRQPVSLRSSRATSLRSPPLFTRRVRVVAEDGSAVTSGSVSCGARVGRIALRVARKGWQQGSAYCTWRLRRQRHRVTLRGVVRIDSQGLSLTHRFAARVK
jgi:hypothetical protein